jgi:hypothetical protein
MKTYNDIFLEFIVNHKQYNEFMKSNYVSIDLLEHLTDDEIAKVPYELRESLLYNTPFKNYFLCDFNIEIREKRYLTILVDEWTRIKKIIIGVNRDIKIDTITDGN